MEAAPGGFRQRGADLFQCGRAARRDDVEPERVGKPAAQINEAEQVHLSTGWGVMVTPGHDPEFLGQPPLLGQPVAYGAVIGSKNLFLVVEQVVVVLGSLPFAGRSQEFRVLDRMGHQQPEPADIVHQPGRVGQVLMD